MDRLEKTLKNAVLGTQEPEIVFPYNVNTLFEEKQTQWQYRCRIVAKNIGGRIALFTSTIPTSRTIDAKKGIPSIVTGDIMPGTTLGVSEIIKLKDEPFYLKMNIETSKN